MITIQPLVSLRGVTKEYFGVAAIRKEDFALQEGEIKDPRPLDAAR